MDKKCSWSSIEDKLYGESYSGSKFDPISVKCDDGYIGKLEQFGFLYKYDPSYGGDSVAEERCKFIVDPLIRYKKPPAPPKCDPELDEQEQIPGCVTE